MALLTALGTLGLLLLGLIRLIYDIATRDH